MEQKNLPSTVDQKPSSDPPQKPPLPQQQQQQLPIMNAAEKKGDIESNILVAIRVRPLNQKEENAGDSDVIRVEDQLMIVLDPIEIEFINENKKMLEVYHRSKEQRYAFDKIFRNHTQEEVYQQTCRHLIKPVIQGFNATVFAYGPTGTGKTYTMLGNTETPGLCSLTIQDIFSVIKKDQENEYSVSITYVEIYNESIRDLLVSHSTYLELRDDPLKGITIAGVTEFKAESTEQVMNLLFLGNRRRTTEATNANQTSSRSHAVFQVTVSSRSRTKNTEQENLSGKLSLIDLAGSERGTVTENRGIRLREGAKINQSLLALANCINALGDKQKKGFFVPYRDSKLTRMLKDSLGGNCKTVMIANVSPSGAQFEETINTLKYANRAKNIKTKVQANKRLVSMHIAEYKNIINDLRSEIEQLKAKLHERIGDNADILNFQEEEQQYLDKLHLNQPQNNASNNNNNGSNSSSNCICGRQEEEQAMRKIQEEIFENFQNRIQLRRGLMEIEEQNAMNILEIKKKQADILLWKRQQQSQGNNGQILNEDDQFLDKQQIGENDIDSSQQQQQKKKPLPPEDIVNMIKGIRTLKVSTEKNTIRKEMMTLSLIENIANAKEIRDRIPKKIKFQDKRNYLELIIKNHVLELQNIEMEINLQIQEKTISDLKNIIEQQKNIINENNIINNNNEVGIDDYNNIMDLSQDDAELEIQDILDEDELDNEMIEDEEDLNDMADLQEILEKQKESQQYPLQSNSNNTNIQEDKKREDRSNSIPNNQNKQSRQDNNILPDINSNINQQKQKIPLRHASKISQDNNVLKNFIFADIEGQQQSQQLQQQQLQQLSVQINEMDENNNETVCSPKILLLKERKKEGQLFNDQKKKNPQKQIPTAPAQQRKKEPIPAGQVNNLFKDISITGQSAIPLSKESGNLLQPLANQAMPQIVKQQTQQQAKDFSGLNLKGKNIVLPSLNNQNSGPQNSISVNNIISGNTSTTNNNNIKDGGNLNTQNRKKR